MKLVFSRNSGVNVLEKCIEATKTWLGTMGKDYSNNFISKEELDEMERLAEDARKYVGRRVEFKDSQAKILVKMLLLMGRSTNEP